MNKSISLLSVLMLFHSAPYADSDKYKYQLQTTGVNNNAYLLNSETGDVWFISPAPGTGVSLLYKANNVIKYRVRAPTRAERY